jgi:alkanesulfonate monooxygenase SsuD/methylene tetrahydromethanopterin reductase-like flavin-dependent oxidoreductase (luciferase family)
MTAYILRAEQLDESLAILTALMSREEAAYEGKHYTLKSTRFLPAPIQSSHIRRGRNYMVA